MASISNVRKSRGRPPVGATPITVRLPPEQLARLDGWISAGETKPTRPEAIRRLIELGLEAAKGGGGSKARRKAAD
jgi:Arc/MetJ-type ribon-helix-helix transcriptional regulator